MFCLRNSLCCVCEFFSEVNSQTKFLLYTCVTMAFEFNECEHLHCMLVNFTGHCTSQCTCSKQVDVN